MIVQITTYGLFGLLTGLGAQALMPRPEAGNRWAAALLGVCAALLGAYLTRLFLFNPGEGTTLFMVVLVSFLVLSAYRTASRRFLEASQGGRTCLS